MSREAVRRRLRELIEESGIAPGPFGRIVLGVDSSTIYRWLAGGPIAQAQAALLLRIEGVMYDSRNGRVVLSLRTGRLDLRSLTRERRRKENAPRFGAWGAESPRARG